MNLAAAVALAGCSLALAAFAHAAEPATSPTTQPFAVRIDVDADATIAPWKPVHRFYGNDEPNYAYMPSGKRLLGELGRTSPGSPVFFRTHNLFTTGDGTPGLKWGSTNIYTEDAEGRPVYDFTIIDRIVDAYLAAGIKPYMQLGFMPEAMSTKPQPYAHHWTPAMKYDAIYTGWAYPPKDYAKWGELCHQWTKHCVERYGKAEAESWYWQVWNEANIGYWKGTPEEFHKLYDFAVAGVRRALPTARVGGPETAGPGGKFAAAFVEHCFNGTNYATGEKGSPLDFVSFHAKGQPVTADGHVRMNMGPQLKNLDDGFRQYAENPKTKALPIIVGECDPEGCAACQGPQLAYRNGTMYSSYTAASFARAIEIADRHKANLEGLLTWAFLFEDQPAFAGFRVLASGSIDHPVMNVFRMFAELRGDRLKATSNSQRPLDEVIASSVRGQPDVGAIATRDGRRIAVLAWHYHDDDVPGADADVEFTLRGIPAGAKLQSRQVRVDPTHANTFVAWQKAGSPKQPTPEQAQQIQAAGALEPIAFEREPTAGADGTTTLGVRLPRQGVSLITIEWTP